MPMQTYGDGTTGCKRRRACVPWESRARQGQATAELRLLLSDVPQLELFLPLHGLLLTKSPPPLAHGPLLEPGAQKIWSNTPQLDHYFLVFFPIKWHLPSNQSLFSERKLHMWTLHVPPLQRHRTPPSCLTWSPLESQTGRPGSRGQRWNNQHGHWRAMIRKIWDLEMCI